MSSVLEKDPNILKRRQSMQMVCLESRIIPVKAQSLCRQALAPVLGPLKQECVKFGNTKKMGNKKMGVRNV